MEPAILVILDYSGTLSMRAPEFARPDRLMQELARSGLAACGIDRAEIFWDDIVNPTWEAGSTTSAGYIPLIVRQVETRHGRKSSGHSDIGALDAAAASFVHAYLDHSAIEPSWRPLLTTLSHSPDVMTVIATDHYAEATDAILEHLQTMHIPGTAMRDMDGPGVVCPGSIVVANSADVGVHKADRRFWEIVRGGLPLGGIQRVLMVDDFGSQEQSGDAYGRTDQVAARRQRTIEMIATVFPVPVDVVDVIADVSASFLNDPESLIRKAIGEIEAYLKRS